MGYLWVIYGLFMGYLWVIYGLFMDYLSSDSSTSCRIRALVPYYSHLLLLLNHVVIVVKRCVEGLMEGRCISNKHSC